MFMFSRRKKVVLAFVGLIAAGLAVVLFTRDTNAIPEDFKNARIQGAIIAQNIVNLSNQSNSDLLKVSEYDRKGDYTPAIELTANLVSQSQQIRDQAVELSAKIAAMTKALSNISAFPARQAALESIASRLALLNQLITYSADLSRLLDMLHAHFNGHERTAQEVQGLVNQINTDVNAINNFNSQAGQAMDRFDKIVGK
jgi:DNA repair ATPase RecN